jgi:hypothetical protein
MSNLSTAAVVANEIVKAVDFIFANDQSIANISVALQAIVAGGDTDYVIGGKVLPYPSGGMNFIIDPIYGHCKSSNVDIMDTVQTPIPVSVESAHPTLDRVDTVQVRGIPVPADFQQRKFKDPEIGTITTDTIPTKKIITLETMVKKGADGSVTAPIADAGWVKIAELRIPAGTVGITADNIFNITARVKGAENNAWTIEKTRTFNPGYLSELIAMFIQAHNDDGSHKGNVIKAGNIKFGIEAGDVNGGVIPTGTSLNVLGTNYTSQVTMTAIIEAVVNAVNTVYLYSNDAFNRFSYIADLPVAASTANVNVTTGGAMVIDGIACTAEQLVFLKNQTDKRQNGYWEVQTGAWNRYPGYTNENAGVFNNKLILVKGGTANAGKVYYLSLDIAEIGSVELDFKESIFSPQDLPGKILIRDEMGKSSLDKKLEDIITEVSKNAATYSDTVDNGRNLLTVLGVNTIPEAMAEIRRRCNNNGEIDSTEVPDFSGILIGDYIDGLDLSGISAPTNGTATQAWNDTYKNNRIVVSGFNTYKNAGDTENTKNHVLFTFRNIIAKGRMNPTDANANGYPASEMRVWLEGASGDGNGTFANKLKTALGSDYLYTIRKLHSKKGNYQWDNFTVWLPTEIEVFGCATYGDETAQANTNVQFPIYQKSTVYRVKRHNGSRHWYWESTPTASHSTNFCRVNYDAGYSLHLASGTDGGAAPAFCVR